ncbi:DNA polymerase III subunit chi [Sphingomonas sp. KR1UV-12]|uniref:DNA polymerase III subunit chi n=1 Tax=Sphingomonas aurea TaxID=3063994 RepID=A0ABT9EH27_9SPHN|nr:DNA polymerase III subunit chi [Sphingomonas sp. KR1UV-12]MDP1026150.1 DNA polymerase III subunit chi [Sphingomonas sp. KR1UV-12]
MQVDFYHLTATPLDRALPRIAERIVAGGGRLLVVSGAEDQRRHLDRHLWAYTPESFLPHAETGGPDDADQPILIAATSDAANGARHIALVDGVWRDDALAFDRAFHFFDDDRIQDARLAWKALAGRDGIERRYWKQGDGGRWEQAA